MNERVSLVEVIHRERLIICKIIKVMNYHKEYALGKDFILKRVYESETYNGSEFDELIKNRYFKEVHYKGDVYHCLDEVQPRDYLSWKEWKEVK